MEVHYRGAFSRSGGRIAVGVVRLLVEVHYRGGMCRCGHWIAVGVVNHTCGTIVRYLK